MKCQSIFIKNTLHMCIKQKELHCEFRVISRMLDDINSELLSIYPGTFPNPRPFSKKPLVYNSGFHVQVRPPLPLYRVQCNNDYIAEKSKKAEAAIRKLYKAAANTGSTISFRETNSIFQHEATTENILSKYRESQIYTRSRLRKVNRKQLLKTINLARRKEEEDTKRLDNISKVDQEAVVSKPKLKQRSYGALRIEDQLFKIKKSIASASASERYDLNENPEESSFSEIDANRRLEAHNRETDNEVLSQAKCPPTVKRPTITKKVGASIRKRSDNCDGPAQNVLQNKEYTFREEEGETAGLAKKSQLKEGNYTKIVTLKKKAWLKPETTVEISSFPFANQSLGKRGTGMLQRVKKEESNNEIDHMYKINDVSHSTRSKRGYQSSSRTGFHRSWGAATPNDSIKETKVHGSKSDGSVNDITQTLDIQESLRTNADEVEHKEPLPAVVHKRGVRRRVPKYKFEGYKTGAVPHGLQPHEPARPLHLQEPSTELKPRESKSLVLPQIESSDGGRSDSRYRLRKTVKREERYLSLPKITPTLTIDDPLVHSRDRRNNYRIGQLQYGGRREVAFVNYSNV